MKPSFILTKAASDRCPTTVTHLAADSLTTYTTTKKTLQQNNMEGKKMTHFFCNERQLTTHTSISHTREQSGEGGGLSNQTYHSQGEQIILVWIWSVWSAFNTRRVAGQRKKKITPCLKVRVCVCLCVCPMHTIMIFWDMRGKTAVCQCELCVRARVCVWW